jgi:hypothetical protein
MSDSRSFAYGWDICFPNASFNRRARNGGISPLAGLRRAMSHLKVQPGGSQSPAAIQSWKPTDVCGCDRLKRISGYRVTGKEPRSTKIGA